MSVSAAARSARYTRLMGAVCAAEGWPAPEPEHRPISDRRWRFDLAWPAEWLAMEVQGGIFTAGRHVQGARLLGEYEKLNAAQIAGWTVLLVIPRHLTDGTARDLLGAYFSRWYPVRYPRTAPTGGLPRSVWEEGPSARRMWKR